MIDWKQGEDAAPHLRQAWRQLRRRWVRRWQFVTDAKTALDAHAEAVLDDARPPPYPMTHAELQAWRRAIRGHAMALLQEHMRRRDAEAAA